MGVTRTPPEDKPDHDVDIDSIPGATGGFQENVPLLVSAIGPDPPKAKLGAVTRKQNEIIELLADVPTNLILIKTLFNEYLSKVESLILSCGASHADWLADKNFYITQFRERVVKAIHPTPIDLGARPKSIRFDGVERLSSSTSHRSSGRSALLKIAEQRAVLQAKQFSL